MHSCCDKSHPAWPASSGNLFPMVGAAEAVPGKLCLRMERGKERIELRATIQAGLEQVCCRGG